MVKDVWLEEVSALEMKIAVLVCVRGAQDLDAAVIVANLGRVDVSMEEASASGITTAALVCVRGVQDFDAAVIAASLQELERGKLLKLSDRGQGPAAACN